MTRSELSLHHEAQRKLNEARELYKTMRLKAYPGAHQDGMPHSTDIGRKVEELGMVLADLADKVKELETAVADTRPAVVSYVHTIDEPRTRMIVSLRVLCGLTWERVGFYLTMTPETARQNYCRLLDDLS